jgi:hypothetical protein
VHEREEKRQKIARQRNSKDNGKDNSEETAVSRRVALAEGSYAHPRRSRAENGEKKTAKSL